MGEANTSVEKSAHGPAASASFRHVLVCVDGSEFGERAIPHARAIAGAFDGSLTLLRVLEHAGREPLDPLEWDIHRREARDYIDALAEQHRDAGCAAGDVQLLEGRAAQEICRWAGQEQTDLTVLCTHGESGRTEWALASTARKLVDRAPGSFLLVPAGAPRCGQAVARYRRLLVPLDGSHRAETVLPVATRLARAHEAELVLAHVVPVPELTEIGPPAAEDIDLRDRLVERNERVASQYLDRLRARLAADGLPVRVVVLRGGEPRRQLARLIERERADLVIVAAHGASGEANGALGSVASSLVARSTRPLLVVRSRPASAMRRARSAEGRGVRLPSQATL